MALNQLGFLTRATNVGVDSIYFYLAWSVSIVYSQFSISALAHDQLNLHELLKDRPDIASGAFEQCLSNV